jgi:hypothetical protein
VSLKTDLATLLASAVADKVFPGIAPQGTQAPYVVWRRNGGNPMATLAGSSESRSMPNIVIFCCATEYDDADTLAQAVRALLRTGSSAIKCNSVGLPIDGFDETTKLLTVAVEVSVLHRP